MPGPLVPHEPLTGFPYSDIFRLLISNQPPLERAAVVVRKLLSEASEIKGSPDSPPVKPWTLSAEQQHWRRDSVLTPSLRIDAYKSILSPVRRLPREMLCEIFLEALQQGPDSDLYFDLTPVTLDTRCDSDISISVWKLGCVSKMWREVVRGYSKLWSCISVDPSFARDPRSASVMRTILSCAREHPLSISYTKCPSTEHLLALLITKCHRWEKAKLSFDDPEQFFELEGVKDKIPMLKALDLCVPTLPPSRRSMHGFSSAPHLYSVSLVVDMGDQVDVDIDVLFPLEQLETYLEKYKLIRDDLDVLAAYELRFQTSLLPQLSNLVTLNLTHNSFAEAPGNTRNLPIHILFPRLLVLIIHNTSVLWLLSTPSLEHLEMSGAETEELVAVLDLCRRSNCTLRSLILLLDSGMSHGDSALFDLLLHTSTLTYLQIWAWVYDFDLFTHLLLRSEDSYSGEYEGNADTSHVTRILPNLKGLHIICDETVEWTPDHLDQDVLTGMLMSRCMSDEPIVTARERQKVARLEMFALSIGMCPQSQFGGQDCCDNREGYDSELEIGGLCKDEYLVGERLENVLRELQEEGLRVQLHCGHTEHTQIVQEAMHMWRDSSRV